jgi:hypothetical protein
LLQQKSRPLNQPPLPQSPIPAAVRFEDGIKLGHAMLSPEERGDVPVNPGWRYNIPDPAKMDAPLRRQKLMSTISR